MRAMNDRVKTEVIGGGWRRTDEDGTGKEDGHLCLANFISMEGYE